MDTPRCQFEGCLDFTARRSTKDKWCLVHRWFMQDEARRKIDALRTQTGARRKKRGTSG